MVTPPADGGPSAKALKADLFSWLVMIAEAHEGPPHGHEDALRTARVMSAKGQLNAQAWPKFLLFCIHVATTQGRHGVGLYQSNATTADAFGVSTATANRWLNLADRLEYFEREPQPSRYGTVNRRIHLPSDNSSPSGTHYSPVKPLAPVTAPARPYRPPYDEPPF